MTAGLRKMPNLVMLTFDHCFQGVQPGVQNNIWLGLKQRKKKLKSLKILNSILSPESYYSLTSFFQSELCSTRVVFQGIVFAKQIENTTVNHSVQINSKVEKIPLFNLMAKLLKSRLQILELDSADDYIYGVEQDKGSIRDNLMRVIFEHFCGSKLKLSRCSFNFMSGQ